MKILVFSDLHLTSKFNQKKFDYLEKLFQNCDLLIVNGDFWSYYSCTFEEFLSSEWNKLFPLMLEKNTIYLYGNHDREHYMDHRKNLFSVKQSDSHEIDLHNKKFHLEHGHKLLSNDSIKNERFISFIRRFRVDDYIKYPISGIIFRYIDPKVLQRFIGKINIQMNRNFIRSSDGVLVTGHSHLAQSSRDYINTGFIDKGLSWYLLIDQNDQNLLSEFY